MEKDRGINWGCGLMYLRISNSQGKSVLGSHQLVSPLVRQSFGSPGADPLALFITFLFKRLCDYYNEQVGLGQQPFCDTYYNPFHGSFRLSFLLNDVSYTLHNLHHEHYA